MFLSFPPGHLVFQAVDFLIHDTTPVKSKLGIQKEHKARVMEYHIIRARHAENGLFQTKSLSLHFPHFPCVSLKLNKTFQSVTHPSKFDIPLLV